MVFRVMTFIQLIFLWISPVPNAASDKNVKNVGKILPITSTVWLSLHPFSLNSLLLNAQIFYAEVYPKGVKKEKLAAICV